jgi:hypothetical protein
MTLKPCGASDLAEYWTVNKETLEVKWHPPVPSKHRRFGDRNYYYCTKEYDTPHRIDLCRKCMVKYGLLW